MGGKEGGEKRRKGEEMRKEGGLTNFEAVIPVFAHSPEVVLAHLLFLLLILLLLLIILLI